MTATLPFPEAPAAPPLGSRKTDLRPVLFPVNLRPLHFRDENNRLIPVDSHRVVVNGNTGEQLGVIGSGYRLVTNEEALGFARQCAAELFGAAHSNLEVFDILLPPRPSFCRIDLIHKGYEVNVFRREVYLPFLRLTNSYNAQRALRFDIGYCRKLCLNGVIFESEVIEFRFPHSWKRIPQQLSFELGKERLDAVRKRFGGRAERLISHEVDSRIALLLFFKALHLPLPKSPEDFGRRAGDLFLPLKSCATSLIARYQRELGSNAYALFNALTDFASRPPALRHFHRGTHSLQTQAGHWLREFDELLQASRDPDFTTYLDRYVEVSGWN